VTRSFGRRYALDGALRNWIDSPVVQPGGASRRTCQMTGGHAVICVAAGKRRLYRGNFDDDARTCVDIDGLGDSARPSFHLGLCICGICANTCMFSESVGTSRCNDYCPHSPADSYQLSCWKSGPAPREDGDVRARTTTADYQSIVNTIYPRGIFQREYYFGYSRACNMRVINMYGI
jgi:hypothetical protein